MAKPTATLGAKRGATMSELAIDICIIGFGLCVVGYAELRRIFREGQERAGVHASGRMAGGT
jgi:hypothetical protein